MEFAVALFGALVNNTLPKLLSAVTEMNKIDAAEFRENARSIHAELGLIQATIQTVDMSTGRDSSPLQKVGFADLCCLAADIEDCIDSFHAGKLKPKKFYLDIQELQKRSKSQSDSIQRWSETASNLTSSPALSSAQRHPAAVAVPQQLQDFLGNNDASNLNCLRYFCMFPCDHPVQMNPLIRRLLAEGLVIPEHEHLTLQDAAAQYFDKLITNQIILPIEESNNGKVKRCKTPQDILEYISKDAVSKYFMSLCDHRKQQSTYVRRLSVRPGCASSVMELNVPDEVCYVRTLAVFPAENPVSYKGVLNFPEYKVLRLLDLKECADVGTLDDIWNLLMLKYLSLGDKILQVPREVENLKMLMTLDLGRAEAVKVYSEILELPNLKHLLGKLHLVTRDIWGIRKKNLRKFLSNGSKLETLSGFVTGKKQGFAMLLSHMKKLKKVKIWCNSRANKQNLKILKEGIEIFISHGVDRSICIDFGSLECYRELVESLSRPAGVGSISSLKLSGSLIFFPRFVASMTAIKEVCLSGTDLTGDKIILGLSKFVQLVYLKLEEQNLGPLDIKPSHFEALKRISLVGVESLGIEIKVGALKELVSLHLICKTLGAHPGPQGVVEINHMTSLKEIVLHSANTDIKDKWERAAESHDNKPVFSFSPST